MNKTYKPKLLRISASVLFAMAVFAAAASAQEMTIVYAYGDPLVRSTGGEEFPAEIGAAVVPGRQADRSPGLRHRNRLRRRANHDQCPG
jgi:hypothetical protein